MASLFNYFIKWNIEFSVGNLLCVGAIVETMEMPLMDFLSGAGSYYPSRAHDSVTVTVVSEDIMSDSYPYADVLVPTSELNLNLFPGIAT